MRNTHLARIPALPICLLLSLFGELGLRDSRADEAAKQVNYTDHVQPILKHRCYACHGALKQEGDLRVDTVAAMLTGGYSGEAVVAGDLDASVLIERILETDESVRMPQESAPLTEEEIATIRAWVEQGAVPPEKDLPEPDPREHWAFKKPVRPEVPQAMSNLKSEISNSEAQSSQPTAQSSNPIDAFLSAQHDKHGLQPVGPADKATLLRRVYLDVIGLPPTREQLHAFLADESPDAYEKLVDQLLASPQYGERWGRHWMDVWRYSDWYGRRGVPDNTNSYAMIWRWRDWIVRSLNEDKGYDRMVLEMLAADEIAPDDDANLVATGFIIRNFYRWNYSAWLKDNVEHTGKAFLALTLNCAHCHDHKYDPIKHEEYFAFRAYFEPLEIRHDRVPGEPDPGRYKEYVYGEANAPIKSGMVRVMDAKLDAETKMYTRGDDRNIIEGKPPIAPRPPAILGIDAPEIAPIEMPPVSVYPGLKPFIVAEERAKAQTAISAAEQRIAEVKAKIAEAEPPLLAELDAARARLHALEKDSTKGESQALAGKQSLFMEALQGRRVLGNFVQSLGDVHDGDEISFELQLWADAHTNFQLALNAETGATAAWIGFEQGRIISYKPGTFDIVELGRYNLPAGQSRFRVKFAIDVTNDRMAITVQSHGENLTLVDAAPTSLNGWNPAKHEQQGIFIDARPGTIVAYDNIRLSSATGDTKISFDFEEPLYLGGDDAAGKDGWIDSPFTVAPAVSVVSSRGTSAAALLPLRQQVAVAQRRLDALRLSMPAAELALVAAQHELASLESRVVAGEAKYNRAPDAHDKARAASLAERTAAHANAAAEEQAAELSLAEMESKPGTDAEITAAKKLRDDKHLVTVAAVETMVKDSDQFTLLSPTYPEKSTGRRAQLAYAIANRDNPLTARVAMNHIWMRHFGKPFVESVFDFGRNGKEPTQPELLDWLAVELMDNNWSMKHVHRLIVTSDAYRRASKVAGDSPNWEIDAKNNHLWHFPRHRMEAEAVRDSMLHLSGQLDLTMGGQEIEQSEAEKTTRRSMYISHHGERRDEFLDSFNVANPGDCYRRVESIVPQQALAMANGVVALRTSRLMARQLWQAISTEVADESAREAAFITATFEHLMSRPPTDQEREISLALLAKQQQEYTQIGLTGEAPAAENGDVASVDPAMRARESLVHALLGHHDFISIR